MTEKAFNALDLFKKISNEPTSREIFKYLNNEIK